MSIAQARQISIVREMFIDTADDNYISARAAYFEHRDRDFWWLTLHAMEKYLKAILLLNGRNTKRLGHAIKPLLEAVRGVDERLSPPPFERPSWLGPVRIFDDVNSDFIWAIDTYGHLHSRYGTYSYVLAQDDILKADHYIYWCRRFAIPHSQRLADGREIDWINELILNPKLWRHHTSSPIEKLVDLPRDDRRRKPLAEANLLFCPGEHEPITLRGGIAHNAPIYKRIEALKESAAGSPERQTEREILIWLIANLKFRKEDEEFINGALCTNP